MSRRQRTQQVVINFDGLTDAVTNLAGVLILVVVLILGITSQTDSNPPQETSAAASAEDDSLEPLLRRVQMLRLQILAVDEEIRRYEQELPELQRRLDALPKGPPSADDNPDGDGRPGDSKPEGIRQGFAAAVSEHIPSTLPGGNLLGLLVAVVGADESSSQTLPGPEAEVEPDEEASREAAAFLEGMVRLSGRQLDDLDKRMPAVAEELRRLLEQAKNVRPPEEQEKSEPARENAEPERQIAYRPPLEQRSDQQTLVFCCREGKIRFVDVDAADLNSLKRRVSEISNETAGQGRGARPFDFEVPGTELRCQGVVEKGTGRSAPVVTWALVLSPALAARGETADRAARSGSQFLRILSSHRPGESCVNFAVWPDSYETFLTLRSVAWKAGYDVGWYPMQSGEPLRMRPGLSLVD